MIAGNVLRNGTYPISVSSERIFQAITIINYAKSIGADAVAHGSTGAGNDQVRFDLTFQILAPEIEIIKTTKHASERHYYYRAYETTGNLFHNDKADDYHQQKRNIICNICHCDNPVLFKYPAK